MTKYHKKPGQLCPGFSFAIQDMFVLSIMIAVMLKVH